MSLFLRELVQVVVPGAKIPYWGTDLLKLGLRGCLNSPRSLLSRVNTLGSGEYSMKLNELMEICTKLSERVLALKNIKTAQDLEITNLKKRVKKLEKKKKSRTSQLKRSTSITTASINITTAEPVITASAPIATAGVSVSTTKPSTPPTTTTTFIEDEDLTIAQTLMKMRCVKSKEKSKEKGVSSETATRLIRGVIMKEASETATRPIIPPQQRPIVPPQQQLDLKDKGKGIMQELEKLVKVKGKNQIEYDVDMAKRLQAELDRRSRLVEKRRRSCNALIDKRNSLLQKELKSKGTNTYQSKTKKEIVYLHESICQDTRIRDFKGKSFDAIKQMFDKAYKQVNDFVPIDTESSRKKAVSKKRAGERPSKESAKRQKIKDDAEKAELKACLEIVPDDDSAVNIESLATKYPIVDSKTHILAEDKMYYQIIRADGSTKCYKIFSVMLDDFDRQDILDLYRLVKERFESTSPEGYDRLFCKDLITLFEPSEEDEIWKAQQDYTLISWRLYDSCGTHLLLMYTGITIHMLVEKKYPLTQEMLSRMLSRRLEVDHECEMAFELLRFIKSQYKKYKNVWIHPPKV
ncbi:hypothetical protein Tco_0117433 [Tanacetum coccineum]